MGRGIAVGAHVLQRACSWADPAHGHAGRRGAAAHERRSRLTAQAARAPSILRAQCQFGFVAQAVFGDSSSGEFAETDGLQFLVFDGLASVK